MTLTLILKKKVDFTNSVNYSIIYVRFDLLHYGDDKVSTEYWNLCVQDCVSGTAKTFDFLIDNDNVDFDYALAA